MDIVLYIIIGIFVIGLIYIIITINKLIKFRKRVEESFTTLDINLKKRWNLIPNLIENVKSYCSYERKTLEEVILLRNTTYANMDTKKKLLTDAEFRVRIPKLMALSESYPELKANDSFQALSTKMFDIDSDIAYSLKKYCDCIKLYNNLVKKAPTSLIAKMIKYEKETNFSIDEEELKNVQINLKV